MNYEILEGHNNKLIKSWTKNVPFDNAAKEQVLKLTSLPFIHKHIAIMPDVHLGMGATIGSVIPTAKAIIPAAVGVDIGCGMMAVKTTLTANELPHNLFKVRSAIEQAVPHGRTNAGGKGDKGAWPDLPEPIASSWSDLQSSYKKIINKHPLASSKNTAKHLGTLGTGNHFIEMCIDENDHVWFMLHSGSRGCGNRIGTYFIERAKEDMLKQGISLLDNDLAYLTESSQHYADYFEAVLWAQEYAKTNREIMMQNTIKAMKKVLPKFKVTDFAVNCHHNYVSFEDHDGEELCITRKGAISAKKDELGIIPGSMGAKSFIVRGLGNKESFCSCSHGAGRTLSRQQAKAQFTKKDHELATQGVECRKDKDVIDETPKAYKDIDAVMKAQSDLVEIVHTLKQVVCVKG